MRYCSSDRNCCITVSEDVSTEHKDSNTDSNLVLGDIEITHPCLVSIRTSSTKDRFVLRSRLSSKDVCSFPRAVVDGQCRRSIDLTKLQGLQITLLEDATVVEDSVATPTSAFQVLIPACENINMESDRMHPDVETLLMDVVTHRKQQDDADVREFLLRRQAQFVEFESEVKAQARILSELVLNSSQKKGDSTDNLNGAAPKSTRRLSENSSQSASSSGSTGRTRVHKSKKRPPVRSSTTPVPKSALSAPYRKTSSGESMATKSSPEMPAKRVMFSEQEPTRIDSPHVLDPSDVEDYGAAKTDGDQEDLFDMDEQIPVVPIPQNFQVPADDTTSAAMRIPSNRGQPFGRQTDEGISGSFALRNLEKYGNQSVSPNDNITPLGRLDIADAEGSPFATSLPRSISRPAPITMTAPLSSVKDIPALSPVTTDSELDTPGDTPPKGISRRKMWRQAVASSMRMSGIVLPGTTREDLDPSLFRASMSGQRLRSGI